MFIYRTIHPVKYLQNHLVSILYFIIKQHILSKKCFIKKIWHLQEQGVRPDNRKFLSFRPVSINVSSIVQADSSAIFKLGDTTAVCGIKAVNTFYNITVVCYINLMLSFVFVFFVSLVIYILLS